MARPDLAPSHSFGPPDGIYIPASPFLQVGSLLPQGTQQQRPDAIWRPLGVESSWLPVGFSPDVEIGWGGRTYLTLLSSSRAYLCSSSPTASRGGTKGTCAHWSVADDINLGVPNPDSNSPIAGQVDRRHSDGMSRPVPSMGPLSTLSMGLTCLLSPVYHHLTFCLECHGWDSRIFYQPEARREACFSWENLQPRIFLGKFCS